MSTAGEACEFADPVESGQQIELVDAGAFFCDIDEAARNLAVPNGTLAAHTRVGEK
jgi:hypothetical protein